MVTGRTNNLRSSGMLLGVVKVQVRDDVQSAGVSADRSVFVGARNPAYVM
jgi:hypothetical protein